MTVIDERLRVEAARQQVTQQEIADAVGTYQSNVSLWLSGRRVPPTKYLAKLADVLGVTTDYLLGRTP